MQTKFNLVILIVLCALAGCAQPPVQPAPKLSKPQRTCRLQEFDNWEITGRMLITNAKDNFNASFSWAQNANQYRIQFYSPFSSETVTITGDELQCRVVTNNGAMDEDLELEQKLPFAQMRYWLKGMPSAYSTPQIATYDRLNQLRTLQQDGWVIEFQKYNREGPVSLPEKITINDGYIKAKLLIKCWQK